MSYRYFEAQDGLSKSMSVFAPSSFTPLKTRKSTTLLAADANAKPESVDDWGNWDVCGGNNPAGIPEALFKATFDEQLTFQAADGVTKWDAGGATFNSALFPVVVRWTSGDRARKASKFQDARDDTTESHAFPVVYRACCSKWAPVKGKQIPHEPKWEEIKLHKLDDNGVAIDGQTRSSVFVDAALIGDLHCARSIVASLENSSVADGSFVYFFPDVSAAVRQNPQYPFLHSDDHKISGASLGMAIFAAVQGWPSILYTGYTSFIVPGYKLQNTSQYAVQTGGSANAQDYYGGRFPKSQTSNNVTTYGDSYVQVGKQIDFVDSVQDLPYKMILAVFHKIPIIIPMTTALNTSVMSYIGEANKIWRSALLNFYQLSYTMANAESGVQTVIVDDNNKYARLLYMGKTIGEFMILAFLAANAQAVASDKAWERNLPVINSRVKGFETVWTKKRIDQGTLMSQRAAENRRQKQDLQEELASGEINEAGWVEKTKVIQRARLEKKKKAKQSEKASSALKSAKRSEIKNKIDVAMEEYKQQYHDAKAELGTKPTAAQKKAFNAAWPSLVTAKKRLNKEALKNIVGVELVKARAPGQATLKLAQRYATAEKILEAKKDIDPQSLINIVNSIYAETKSLDPIQYKNGQTSKDVLQELKGQIQSIMQGNQRSIPAPTNMALYNPSTLANRQAARQQTARRMEFARKQNPANRGEMQDINTAVTIDPDLDLDNDPVMSSNRNNNNNGNDDDDQMYEEQASAPKIEPGSVLDSEQASQYTSYTDPDSGVLYINGQPSKYNSQDDTFTIMGATSKFRGFDNKTGSPYGSKTKLDARAAGQFGASGKMSGRSPFNKMMDATLGQIPRLWSKGEFASAARNRQSAASKFSGAGRLPPRRIINRPQNDADMDMTAWNPFSFIKDVGEGIIDGVGTVAKVANKVVEHAVPVIGAGVQLARAFK